MMLMAWNYRGIGLSSVVRSLRVFSKTHRPSILFLSELKTSSYPKIQKLLLSFGFSSFEFIPAVGKSGGIVLCWKYEINLQVTISNSNLINSLIFSDPSHTPWMLTSVYGSTIPSLKHAFWNSMFEIDSAWQGPWCLFGDFNTVIDQMDKQGGRPVAQSSAGGLRGVVQDRGLIDLGFTGHQFTWNNKRSGGANIQERLDRGFGNGQWRLLFPQAFIQHLPSLNSDHKPLLLNTSHNFILP